MDNKHGEPGWFEKQENINKILKVFYVICAILVIIDIFAVFHIGVHRHIYHSWENAPAFYAIYGFVGCVVLVLIAKGMRKFLMKEEDYYDK